MLKFVCSLLLTVAALSVCATEGDKPFLHRLFTENMVLQREIECPIWGWTEPGKQVTVSMEGKTASATADASGQWLAKIGPFPAGGPYKLTVAGPQSVTLENVLVGDVWICSGQSNMEMGIGVAGNAKEEIAKADFPQIRLYTVPKAVELEPTTALQSQWLVCTPKNIATGGWGGFSAAGYFFGRHLHTELKIPIGLIHTSWGGTICEAWASGSALKAMPDFVKAVEKVEADAAKLKTQPPPPAKPAKANPNVATVLYNGMIAPLLPYGIKGAIWYQGESNAGRGIQYRTLLPTMIKDWRARFGVGEFPFFIVQIANFKAVQAQPTESAWAELREAQALTAQTLPRTGLANIIDIGEAGDIHPKNKQEVGRRLGLAAQAIAYGQKLEYSGPIYREMEVQGQSIRLKFDHVGGGLLCKGDTLKGFAICGADKKYVWGEAKIDGDTVVVSAPQVTAPAAVRYAWADNPVCNLYNKDGLPAVSFRTDSPK